MSNFSNNQPSPSYSECVYHKHTHIHKYELTIECGPSLTTLLQGIYGKLNEMTKEIDDLKTAVTAETTVVQSAIVLINGISDRVAAAVTAALAANPGVDLSPLTDLTNEINTEASALASAVASQTPVTTAVPNDPVV